MDIVPAVATSTSGRWLRSTAPAITERVALPVHSTRIESLTTVRSLGFAVGVAARRERSLTCSFYSAPVLRSLLAGAGAADADEGGNNLLLIIILIAVAVVVVVVVAYFVRRQRAGVIRREVTSAPPPDR